MGLASRFLSGVVAEILAQTGRGAGASRSFICSACGNEWSREADADGLVDGYGLPPCPECGNSGSDPNDYGDFTCPYCGHSWRNYGNGGLVLGCWPNCPKCGTVAEGA